MKRIYEILFGVLAFILMSLAVFEFKDEHVWLCLLFAHTSVLMMIFASLSDCQEIDSDDPI